MVEQETASIIRFILNAAEAPNPYYWRVPQNFLTPAVYFPSPEISSRGNTFGTYALDFMWFINFFDSTTQAAYSRAYASLTAIRAARNLIPLIDQNGAQSERGIRIEDPSLNTIDNGAVQLQVKWTSRREYTAAEVEKVSAIFTSIIPKEELVPDYIADSVASYLPDTDETEV